MKKYDFITKKLLIEEYNKNRKSPYQISEELGCSENCIRKKLIKFNIYIRGRSEAHKKYNFITKKLLIKKYSENKKSLYQIAKKLGCSPDLIYRRLKEYNIEIRTKSEAMKELYRDPKNHPNYIDGRKRNKHYCIEPDCNNEICYDNWRCGKGRCKSCSAILKHKIGILNVAEKNNPNWKGGISRLPYSFRFSDELKAQICKRDYYTCQICGKKQSELKGYHRKLAAHHIDYNKQNCDENNLISLCHNCHMKTNHSRDYWFAYFTSLIERNKKEKYNEKFIRN